MGLGRIFTMEDKTRPELYILLAVVLVILLFLTLSVYDRYDAKQECRLRGYDFESLDYNTVNCSEKKNDGTKEYFEYTTEGLLRW